MAYESINVDQYINLETFSRFQQSNFKIVLNWLTGDMRGKVGIIVNIDKGNVMFFREYLSDKAGEENRYKLVHKIPVTDPPIRHLAAKLAFAPTPVINEAMMNGFAAYLINYIQSSVTSPYPDISYYIDKYGGITPCCHGRFELTRPVELVSIIDGSRGVYSVRFKFIQELQGCKPGLTNEYQLGTINAPNQVDGNIIADNDHIYEHNDVTLQRNDKFILLSVYYSCDDTRENFIFPYPAS